MGNLAFYCMTSKGFYVLKKFIENYGANNIEYIICAKDENVKNDFHKEIVSLASTNNISCFNRNDHYLDIEKQFCGHKIAIGWRWLIKNEANLIVFHDSILPKYRGFAPLVNCLICNEDKIGVTALFADSEYDKGDIIDQKEIKIQYPIKIADAIRKVEPLYYLLLKAIYHKISNNLNLESFKQKETEASYSLWLDEKDYFIDWKWSSSKIKRFVDAVGYPYDNAKTYINGKILNVIDVETIEDRIIKNRTRHIGKVIFIQNGKPIIICNDGLLAINRIEDKNKQEVFINFRSRFT